MHVQALRSAHGSATNLARLIGDQFLCLRPLLFIANSTVAPFGLADGRCFFGIGTVMAACSKYPSTNIRRFCVCTDAPSSGRRLLGYISTSVYPRRALVEDRHSGGQRLASPLSSVGLLLGSMYAAVHGGSRAVVLLGALLAYAQSTDAHNWVHTPSRAYKEASVVRPCRARKPTDTHAQVGPGQVGMALSPPLNPDP